MGTVLDMEEGETHLLESLVVVEAHKVHLKGNERKVTRGVKKVVQCSDNIANWLH